MQLDDIDAWVFANTAPKISPGNELSYLCIAIEYTTQWPFTRRRGYLQLIFVHLKPEWNIFRDINVLNYSTASKPNLVDVRGAVCLTYQSTSFSTTYFLTPPATPRNAELFSPTTLPLSW